MARVIFGAALGVAAAAAAALEASAGADWITGGYSRTQAESDRLRAKAKAERETWDQPPETRQQRRARERREFKRLPKRS